MWVETFTGAVVNLEMMRSVYSLWDNENGVGRVVANFGKIGTDITLYESKNPLFVKDVLESIKTDLMRGAHYTSADPGEYGKNRRREDPL